MIKECDMEMTLHRALKLIVTYLPDSWNGKD